MTAELADPITVADPGYCSQHPGLPLVAPSRLYRRPASYWTPAGWDTPNVCASPVHAVDARDEPSPTARRCMWCGGALYPADTPRYRINDRKGYCTPNHRLLAHRARRRAS